jgi:hypothetical protein
MVERTGLEPATFDLQNQRSSQLSYNPMFNFCTADGIRTRIAYLERVGYYANYNTAAFLNLF